jgi:hypothetical protein
VIFSLVDSNRDYRFNHNHVQIQIVIFSFTDSNCAYYSKTQSDYGCFNCPLIAVMILK